LRRGRFVAQHGLSTSEPEQGSAFAIKEDALMFEHRKSAKWLLLALVALAIGAASAAAATASARPSSARPDTSARTNADIVAQAKAVVDKYYTKPKSWPGPTTGPKPLKGKTLAIVSSGLQSEGSARPTYAARDAAKLLGWKAVVYDGNNEQLKDLAAVNAAVDAKSSAIILVLIDPSTIGAAVQRALNAHIPVATVGVPVFLHGQRVRAAKWDSIPDVSWDLYQQGVVLANYMIWKANGKPHVYVEDVPDFAAISLGQTAGGLSVFNNKAKCPDCVVYKNSISVSEFFTQTGPAAVAMVQAHPDINWLYLLDAGLEVEINSLATANLLGSIQGGGFDCNPNNLNFIRQGHGQAVCIAESSQWAAWGAVDAVNRMMNHQKPVTAGYPAGTKGPGPNYTLPIFVVDKKNIGTLTKADIANGWQGGIDFRAHYRKIWGMK
jgi:ribose transport system substrate-binding protein